MRAASSPARLLARYFTPPNLKRFLRVLCSDAHLSESGPFAAALAHTRTLSRDDPRPEHLHRFARSLNLTSRRSLLPCRLLTPPILLLPSHRLISLDVSPSHSSSCSSSPSRVLCALRPSLLEQLTSTGASMSDFECYSSWTSSSTGYGELRAHLIGGDCVTSEDLVPYVVQSAHQSLVSALIRSGSM